MKKNVLITAFFTSDNELMILGRWYTFRIGPIILQGKFIGEGCGCMAKMLCRIGNEDVVFFITPQSVSEIRSAKSRKVRNA